MGTYKDTMGTYKDTDMYTGDLVFVLHGLALIAHGPRQRAHVHAGRVVERHLQLDKKTPGDGLDLFLVFGVKLEGVPLVEGLVQLQSVAHILKSQCPGTLTIERHYREHF